MVESNKKICEEAIFKSEYFHLLKALRNGYFWVLFFSFAVVHNLLKKLSLWECKLYILCTLSWTLNWGAFKVLFWLKKNLVCTDVIWLPLLHYIFILMWIYGSCYFSIHFIYANVARCLLTLVWTFGRCSWFNFHYVL